MLAISARLSAAAMTVYLLSAHTCRLTGGILLPLRETCAHIVTLPSIRVLQACRGQELKTGRAGSQGAQLCRGLAQQGL